MPYVKKISLIPQTFTEGPRKQRIPKDGEPRGVFANIDSIGQSEFFQASASGFTPAGKATMWQFEYHGETVMELEGERYAIYRTYKVPGTNKVEIYFAKQLAANTPAGGNA